MVDGKALLVTEKVIDHIQFCSAEDNNWEYSDLRKWLNNEFLNTAFNDEEQAQIIENAEGDKVSLLSLDDYDKYFPDPKDARTAYTDYSRKKTEDDYHTTIREPYAFWWLKTANEEGGWGEKGNVYVLHVCNNGLINSFERATYSDGVRPAIWVAFKE